MRQTDRSPVVTHDYWRLGALAVVVVGLLLMASQPTSAQVEVAANTAAAPSESTAAEAPQGAAQAAPTGPYLDLYGFAMLDMIYQVKQNHPDWFDTVRPTKLPSFDNEFGQNGNFFAGVRQSRLGFRGYVPTSLGELRTVFEFELFGTGADAGQTTFRLRHAYGELGFIGAGQYWTVFGDQDVFPNTIEYWGPNGIVWFRNVQLRFMPLRGRNSVTVALERPGASGDGGTFASRVEIQNIQGRFTLPDLTGNFRMTRDWGHVQIAGVVRRMHWDDVLNDQFQLSGKATGWGISTTSNIKIGRDTVHLSVVYGEGIENYMNDAPVDIGIRNNFSNPVTPILGEPLPLLGIMAFYDRTWNDKYTSSFGYSREDIQNSNGQAPDAFNTGQYFVANVLATPVKNFMLGPEVQWGWRENKSDGFKSDDYRLQFSLKYNFSFRVGGQ